MNYVIIPDLHGEFRVLEQILNYYPTSRYILLGDIIDRGESSYRTFLIVKSLIESGKAEVVKSNHDDKFYRFLKKWIRTQPDIYTAFDYRVSFGFEKTLKEFYNLPVSIRLNYAKDFLEYYQNIKNYILMFDNQNNHHYFVHAGAHESMYTDNHKDCIYRHNTNLSFLPEESTVHIGHDDRTPGKIISNMKRTIVYHDIGIGKSIRYKQFNINDIKTLELRKHDEQ